MKKLFKSIFSKYLATFTVILLACITAILFAVSSRIAADSYNIQRDTMNASAGSAALVIDTYLENSEYENIYTSFYHNSDLQRVIEYTASNAKAEIYVFDCEGVLVGTSDNEFEVGKVGLSEFAFNTMLSTNESYSISTVENFFENNRMNSYHVFYAEETPFIVLMSMSNYSSVVFTKEIVIVAITVSLWMFLAAMLALYVISRRTTEPLSEIISAAKDYAKGRFDT